MSNVPNPQDPTVPQILDDYLSWCRRHRAPRTARWYADYLGSFAEFLGALPEPPSPGRLTPAHVYRWVEAHPGWKSARGPMTAVQRCFNWAAKAGLLPGGRSPLVGLEKPPQGRREQLVSEPEYAQVLTALRSPEARDLVTLSWETGMRPAELFTCEAAFLDGANRRIVFPVKLSKGKRVQRVVYLTDAAWEVASRNAALHPTGALLRNTEGAPWTRAAVNCLFQRVRRTLGLRRVRELGLEPPPVRRRATGPLDARARARHRRRLRERRRLIRKLAWEHGTKYSLYAFRHAFCTEALVNGLDAVTVSVLMGHRDTTMISRHYAHVCQRTEHMRAAARKARGAA